MYVFAVTITGDHIDPATHRFYGLAPDAETAIELVRDEAKKLGWKNAQVVDVSLLGDLEFFPGDGALIEEVQWIQ